MRNRSGSLAAGVLALVLPLAACGGNDDPASPPPTDISIAPSSVAPTSAPGSPSSSTPKGTPATDPSTARSEAIDLRGAVTAAEAAIPDSTAVEVSKEDDGTVAWEVKVRAGANGRELRLSSDGSVLSNTSDSLSSAERGDPPTIDVLTAVATAEKRVKGGVVTEVELTTENGQRVWDLSVDGSGGDEWEVWVDAASGKVLREERD